MAESLAPLTIGTKGRLHAAPPLSAHYARRGRGRVDPAARQRDVFANLLTFSSWRHGDDPGEHMAYTRRYWTHLEPFTHGFYVNDLLPETSATAIRENYRHNHDRLVAVKNRYDPTNLFRLNANVTPSA